MKLFQSTMRRQTKLRDKWYFTCQCHRCLDPSEKGSHVSSLLCPALIAPRSPNAPPARCSGVMMSEAPLNATEKRWKCGNCPHSVDGRDVLDMENGLVNHQIWWSLKEFFFSELPRSCKKLQRPKTLTNSNFCMSNTKTLCTRITTSFCC